MHCSTFVHTNLLRPVLIAMALLASRPLLTVAQTPESLKLVPADVAFYSSGTRLRQQYDTFVNSNAFAKLKSMPIVQQGWAMVEAQWNDPDSDLAPLKAFIDDPANEQLVGVAIDAVSHEIFLYGDEGFGDLIALMNDINRANQQAQLAALGGADVGDLMAQQMLQVLSQHLDTLKVPDTVIGFRLSDTKPAIAELDRAEALLKQLLAQQPMLVERLSRVQVGGGDFLTLKLDGSLIPWEELENEEGPDISDIREKVSKMTLSISLGVKDRFLMLSIGDNNDHLGGLGEGELLAQRKELAPLEQHAQKPITGVQYVSGQFMESANSVSQQVDQFTQMAQTFLPFAGLDATLQQELVQDISKLGDDIKSAIPKPGAVAGFSFLSDRGYEGYSYNWGENQTLDGSKPLPILEHVGGDPLCVFAARGVYSPESYDVLSKWLGRVIYYGEQIGVEQLGEGERSFYEEVRDDLEPLVKQLDQVTRKKILPTFRDGQAALVLDAKTTSDQWHVMLPPSTEPLPMLEFGLVYGVSDAGLLKEAADDYYRITQQIIDTLHEADPEEIPPLKLPAPESREFPGGTIFYYRLPRELGLDKQVAPNAGLSQDTLVLTAIPKLTVRLLNNTPFQATGPLAETGRPLAAAFRLDFSGLLDVVAPWIDYGVTTSGQEIAEETTDQIATGIEILKCFRGVSSVTYEEGDALVSHYEAVFEDLP